LARLHETGVIHRDVKPDNFLVSSKHTDVYKVVIADFGLAQILPTDSARLTIGCVGTATYRAPEVLDSEYSWHVDVFGLGIVIWEVLSGKSRYKHLKKMMEKTPNQQDMNKWMRSFQGIFFCLFVY